MSKKDTLKPSHCYIPHEKTAALLADFQMAGYSLIWRKTKGEEKQVQAWLSTESHRWNISYTPDTDEWRLWDRTGATPSRAMDTATMVKEIEETLA